MNFSLINSESWFESDTVNLIYLIGSITLRWWWSVLLSTKQINMYLRKLSFAEFQSYLLNLLIEIHLNLVWQVHGQMWVFDCKEHWEPKNFCFWTVVLEKTLESPLDCKEIQPVHPKGHQPWIFTGRTDAKIETPILWPPDVKSWLIWKDPDARKDWRREKKGTTEDEVVRWHHRRDRHEYESTPGVGDGQGSLPCCSPWSCRVGHNWATELNWMKKETHFKIHAYLLRWAIRVIHVVHSNRTYLKKEQRALSVSSYSIRGSEIHTSS